jgi:hypothetical protein
MKGRSANKRIRLSADAWVYCQTKRPAIMPLNAQGLAARLEGSLT